MGYKQTLQRGTRVLNGADGSQTGIPYGSKTAAEMAPSLSGRRALPKADASVPSERRGKQIDDAADGTTDPTSVEYGGHRGSSTGQ